MGKKYSQKKKDALAHYRRMIKWAKKQPKRQPPHREIMRGEIGEEWHGADCVYCVEEKGKCMFCVLNGGAAAFNCCNGLWYKMATAGSWESWIYYAEKIVQYIKNNG